MITREELKNSKPQPRQMLNRVCKDCGVKFMPNGKFQRFCEECQYTRRSSWRKTRNELRKDMNKLCK